MAKKKDSLWTCPKCNETFESSKELIKHQENKNLCSECCSDDLILTGFSIYCNNCGYDNFCEF